MKKIEDIFKQKLANKTAPYSDDLWSRIENDLDSKSEPTRYLPFVWGAGVIVMVVAVLFFGLSLGDDSASSKEATIIEKNDIKSSLNQSNQIQNEANNVTSPELIENDEASNNSLLLNSDSQTLNKPQIYSDLNSTLNQSSLRLAPNSTSIETGLSNLNTSQLEYGNSPYQYTSISSNSIIPNDQSILKNTIDQQKGQFEFLKSENKVISLDKIRTSQLSDYSYISDYEIPEFKNIVDCSTSEDKKPGFSLDLYFSPEYAVKDLNAKEEGSTSYLNARNRTENAALSYSTGMRLSYNNASGLSFRTGFNYSQINETLDYSESVVDKIDTTITIQTSTDQNGQTTTTIDTTTETHYIQVNYKTRNNFKSIDIPLLVGLEMPINQRFSLSMNTGVYVNTLFKASGRILDPELRPVWINDESSDREFFKMSLGVSFYGSIGLHHELSPGLELLVEPNMRYYSQSFTVGNYPLTQDYIKFGVLTGLRYKF